MSKVKRLLIKKKVTAFLLVFVLLCSFLLNAGKEQVFGKYLFIESYGLIQKLLGKNEVSNFEVVRDKEGKLHYTYFGTGPSNTSILANRMINLQNSIQDKKTKLIFMMPMSKYIKGYTEFPTGIPYDYDNETADDLLMRLETANIDTIDLRDYIDESKIEKSKLFYDTDHHWTTQSAFFATNKLFDVLEENYNEKIENEDIYSDIDNYETEVYEDSFLGSMGRKVGKLYGGVDDFTLIYPKFQTKFTFQSSELGDTMLSGDFKTALLSNEILKEKDLYKKDSYATYLYGNTAFAHIKNESNPNGPKILFIKDSFAVPVAAFASLRCSDVYLIDPRFYKESIENFINSNELDYVITTFSSDNLAKEFFTFGVDEEKEAKLQ